MHDDEGVSRWDAADSKTATDLARRFESLWRAGRRTGKSPDPVAFLRASPTASAGDRLAVLRADLGLRWEAGEPASVEDYLGHIDDLSNDALVALLYEEFCLAEESGTVPDPAEFVARFPALSESLGRILEIHEFVGTSGGDDDGRGGPDGFEATFPEAGQTIGGFWLHEELGRGAFARVFRAAERQLADRSVALKVSRRVSAEPEALAKLQHTHIVPIYSYGYDLATGFHLICMPDFGKTTLARLLEDPETSRARHGSDLLAITIRLEDEGTGRAPGPAGARGFAALPFCRAVAWWGARLAEALEHAHGRGILHLDIKPSNVLVTLDGMPMLLDFNLAKPAGLAPVGEVPPPPGGTLAYMAPEHLEALADGTSTAIDHRADLYALGVLLYETIGLRPFAVRPPAPGLGGIAESLRAAALDRRNPLPSLRLARPEVPAALEIVLRKCLAPKPADRYQTASELAADLRAISEDKTLPNAREPLAPRASRWVRTRKRRLSVAAAVGLALGGLVAMRVNGRIEALRAQAEAIELIGEGRVAEIDGRHDVAASQFQAAALLTRPFPDLLGVWREARDRLGHSREAQTIEASAEALFREAEPLRFALLGFGPGGEASPPFEPEPTMQRTLKPFYVLVDPRWTERPELSFLGPVRRPQLIDEVERLLFFWAVSEASGRARGGPFPERAAAISETALQFSKTPGPWRALRDRCLSPIGDRPEPLADEPDPSSETSAWACFQWALIQGLVDRDRPATAIAWLDRSVALDPSRYWAQYYLARYYDEADDATMALAHYNAAIALRPDAPFALAQRAALYARSDLRERAEADLERASALDPTGQARRQIAEALFALGRAREAEAAWSGHLDDHPLDLAARLGRARSALRLGDPESALDDLERIVLGHSHRPTGLFTRALVAYVAALPRSPDGLDRLKKLARKATDLDRAFPSEESSLPVGEEPDDSADSRQQETGGGIMPAVIPDDLGPTGRLPERPAGGGRDDLVDPAVNHQDPLPDQSGRVGERIEGIGERLEVLLRPARFFPKPPIARGLGQIPHDLRQPAPGEQQRGRLNLGGDTGRRRRDDPPQADPGHAEAVLVDLREAPQEDRRAANVEDSLTHRPDGALHVRR